MMAVPAIKGVEIGLGFDAARRRGSEVHDAIAWVADPAGGGRFTRPTNRAGGTEGGITNGEDVVVRAAMKPISTLKKPLASVDVRTKEAVLAAHERSDVCAVAAASVVGEAVVRLVLADAVLEKFGSDSVRELVRTVDAWRAQIRSW
jgi:chorismate synthase